MNMYRFNNEGSVAFANGLADLSRIEAPVDADFAKIKDLASDASLISAINGGHILPAGPFASRYEMCLRIYNAIKTSSLIVNFDPTDSFWSWLSAWYFDDLTSFTFKDGSIRRKLSKERESPAYVWSKSYKKAYRHRLGHGVFMIHHLGEVLAKPMLLSHPGSMSDYCEQTFARVGSYKEKAVIEAAHSIYYDGEKVAPGASSERRWGLRHLHREVAQCLVNYEMNEMGTDELLAFLPPSFKNKGFNAWSRDAKLVAYLIHSLPATWHDLFPVPQQGSVQWVADQVGCTKRDLDETLAELKAIDGNPAGDRGWVDVLESLAEEHGSEFFFKAVAAVILGKATSLEISMLSAVDSL